MEYLDIAALATRVGVCKRTLLKACHLGQLPKPHTIAGRIMWPMALIKRWEAGEDVPMSMNVHEGKPSESRLLTQLAERQKLNLESLIERAE